MRSAVASVFFGQVAESAGIVSAHAGFRHAPDGDEVALITAWETPEAALAVLGSDMRRAQTVPGLSEHVEVLSVDHYEVDDSILGSTPAAPEVLRIAAGSIELGGDVQIQQELRRRLGSLGSDVSAAYVGRRMRGRNVEVVLVTVWNERPIDRPLEEPIWPDIAARYESFWVETYEPIDSR